MQLLESGLVTDDPQLAPICEKLKPFQAKLGNVSRAIIDHGLGMVPAADDADVELAAKHTLVALADKLWGMRSMFGVN
jgi:hypothetical protein